MPKEVSGHGESRVTSIPKGDRGIGKRDSRIILKVSGKFIQPGSVERVFEFRERTTLDLANGYLGVSLTFLLITSCPRVRLTKPHPHCSNISFTDVTVRQQVSAKSKLPSDQITDTPE
ncbi:hypothetical protein P5673_013431 [Acropora cervicornis]|uniref:Uncharacterized protein n=1 Tax=Acropora cervicornis TaxID=6130 RepID=A0AAD9QKS7_ACRCE|nr:hypothetical protein P5673_013431 [Acropora cervicornis]